MSRFNWACPTCGAATHSKEALVRSSEKSCSCDSALWVASDMPPCVGKLQEEIAALRAIARSAAQEEETKLDENQFITQQSRIVKLAALREAGYGGGE